MMDTWDEVSVSLMANAITNSKVQLCNGHLVIAHGLEISPCCVSFGLWLPIEIVYTDHPSSSRYSTWIRSRVEYQPICLYTLFHWLIKVDHLDKKSLTFQQKKK
eukprot:183258_1